jgi:tetratricopeptide (TPR) repeat protein
LLLGETVPGAPPISIDVAAAIFAAVFRDGSEPFVSLDPDPANPTGPQKVRVGGLEAGLARSELVRLLLEADYAMKRVNLGVDPAGVVGFRSWADLVGEKAEPGSEQFARFWLVPAPLGPATVYELSDGPTSRATVFRVGVQVMTEALKRRGDALLGTGGSDPISDEAADLFTQQYGALAASRPALARLEGVFDLVVLAKVLRERGVTHDGLAALAGRAVPAVEIPESYAGIGPITVGSRGLWIAGGALARARAPKAAVVAQPALAPALAARAGEPIDLALPAVTELGADAARGLDFEVQRTKALATFQGGELAQAEKAVEAALALEPDDLELVAIRASIRLGLNRRAEARADAERVAAARPALRALVGFIRLHDEPDPEAALADATAAEAVMPDDEGVLGLVFQTRMFAGDFAGAEATLDRLAALNPLSPDVLGPRLFLDVLYRLGPGRARARMKAMLASPPAVREAIVVGGQLAARLDLPAARARFETCLALTEKGVDAGAQAYYPRERCLVALAQTLSLAEAAAAPTDTDGRVAMLRRRDQALDELARLHPSWATVELLRAKNLDATSALALLRRVAKAPRSGDPIFEDLTVLLGTDRVIPWYGLALWFGAKDRDTAPGYELLAEVGRLMGAGWDADLVKALVEVGTARSVREAIDTLSDALGSVPKVLPGDVHPVSLFALGYLSTLLVKLEARQHEPDGVRRAAGTFFRLTAPVDSLAWDVLLQPAAFRADMANDFAKTYEDELLRGRASEELVAEARAGRISPAAARQKLDALVEGFVARATAEGGPYGGAITRLVLAPVADSRATTIIDGYGRGNPPQAVQAEAEAWRADLGAGGFDRKRTQARLRAKWAAYAEAATTIMDARTVAVHADLLRARAEMPGASPEDRDELAASIEAVATRLRVHRLPKAHHDWSAWKDSPVEEASILPTKSGSSTGVVALVLGAIAAAGASVVAWQVRRRARRRA